MLLVSRSSYSGPSLYQLNGHPPTLFPALRFRPALARERERIDTPDDDFLDLELAVDLPEKTPRPC